MAELAFNAESHTYTLDGRALPSVTQVLDPLNELDGVPRDVLAAATEFGTHVHLACDLHDAGRLDRAALDPALEPYLCAWERFLAEADACVIESELRVHHPLGFAGTVDKIIMWRGKHHVLDIKSGTTVPRTWRPQTAAYREAVLQQRLACSTVRYCVHLRGDGTYVLHKSNDPADWSVFVSALNLYRWRNS